jgi:glucan phosphoethanolaminetransferase (alkaline phosphatase superfamily)
MARPAPGLPAGMLTLDKQRDMEALTVSGLILFIIVMLFPIAAFIWALLDLRRRPKLVKALIKISVCIVILSLASSTSSVEIILACLGIIVGILGVRELVVLLRNRETNR